MNDNEAKGFATLLQWVGFILILVVFWDIYGLKVSSWPYYYPYKIFVIGSYFIMAYLINRRKISPVMGFEISMVIYYLYSFIGTTYLHSTYIFAFFEGFVVFCFIYSGSPLRYSLLTILAFVLSIVSVQTMPEPDFVKEGQSIKHHLHVLLGVMALVTFLTYWLFSRQRKLIARMDQKFASIGRQSAFLLHELKSPLSRFMVRNSDKDNRDAEYILSIVDGVELLITKKENLSLMKFDWKDIKSYLEDEFQETCKHYQIQFEIDGMEGECFGHRSTIKLALKNLIKNAVESIAHSNNKQGTIRVKCRGNIIEVSNNGSIITKEKIEQLFKPFYSEKNSKTNYGIGLHFVESVVKAHDGTIGVHVEDGWSIFKIKLGEKS